MSLQSQYLCRILCIQLAIIITFYGGYIVVVGTTQSIKLHETANIIYSLDPLHQYYCAATENNGKKKESGTLKTAKHLVGSFSYQFLN